MSGHDSYLVKIHGSNRVTRRNRQFLRKILPYQTDEDHPVQPSPTTQTLTFPVEQVTLDQSTDDYVDPADAQISQPDSVVEEIDDTQHHGTEGNDSTPQSTPHRVPRPLPRHLREKWFVNPNYPSLPAAPTRDDAINAYMPFNHGSSPNLSSQLFLPQTQLPVYPNPVPVYTTPTYHGQFKFPAYSTDPHYSPSHTYLQAVSGLIGGCIVN